MSLNNLSNCLNALGRREEALAASEEAVRILKDHFLDLPAAYAKSMQTVVRNYLRHCQAIGNEPDKALLGPIRYM